MRNKMGRFSEEAQAKLAQENDPNAYNDVAKCIKVGDRCEVDVHGTDVLKRRGTVKYVGQTEFKPGFWVGVHYDEPYGMNDGAVGGVRYFTCPSNHGSFVRPNKVTVGNFPEEDLSMDELEEM